MVDTTRRSNMSKLLRHGSPSHAQNQQLSADEISMLQEPDFYRKKGDKVDEALYRDHLKRMARHKLMQEANIITQKQQAQGVKLTVKTQQLAIQKLEKDLDALIKIFSHENADKKEGGRFVSRDELIQLLRVIECFRELDTVEHPNNDASFLMGKNSFISNTNSNNNPYNSNTSIHNSSLSRSISPHIKKDSFRQGQRMKQEEEFLQNLWTYFLSPMDDNRAQFEIVNEVFKIMFNHYIPNSKQIELLMDLQGLVNSVDFGKHKQLLREDQIEEKIIKRFQSLYNHYFNLNNIAKISNSEKRLSNVREHFKEFTFKPKINPESTNLDYQNLTSIYYKMQNEQKGQRDKSGVKLNQTLQKEGQPDIEVVEPEDSDSGKEEESMVGGAGDESLNLNEGNLHKFNTMLSKYLQEYKMSEISASHHPDSHRNDKNHLSTSKQNHISQTSMYTQNESVKTVLIHQVKSTDKSITRTPKGRNQVKIQPSQKDQNKSTSVNHSNNLDTSASKQKTPEKVFRFEYWYLQEKLKQDKIKKMIEEKMKNDVKQCTFKPKINNQQQQQPNTANNRSRLSNQSKSPTGLSANNDKSSVVTPTGQRRVPLGKPPITPQSISGNKFEALYQNEKEKRKVKEDIAKQRREERELKQLEECTFKPILATKSKSPVNDNTSAYKIGKQNSNISKSPVPQGYEDNINRMRLAQKEKERQKQLLENLGKVKRENVDSRSITPTKQQPFNLSYQQKLDNKKYLKEKEEDVLLYMEILVKQGQKVKLKVKRNDSPRTVARNFAKIYGLNQKSEEALANIISDQIRKDRLHISSIKTTSQQSKEGVPTTIREGVSSMVEDDSFDSRSFQQLNNLSAIKNTNQRDLEQSLGMIDEKQEQDDLDSSSSLAQSQVIKNQTNQFEYDNLLQTSAFNEGSNTLQNSRFFDNEEQSPPSKHSNKKHQHPPLNNQQVNQQSKIIRDYHSQVQNSDSRTKNNHENNQDTVKNIHNSAGRDPNHNNSGRVQAKNQVLEQKAQKQRARDIQDSDDEDAVVSDHSSEDESNASKQQITQ